MSEQEKESAEIQQGGQREGQAGVPGARVTAGPSRLALVLALVALISVGLGLVMGYRYWSGMKTSLEQLNISLRQAGQEQALMSERLAQTTQFVQQQQQRLAEQDQMLSEQRQQWERERSSLQQQEMHLNQTLSQMQQRLGGKVGLWQVAEAEYLMRLAQHRLSLMGDPSTALAALKSADERLQATGDPGWDEPREILAREVAALEAVPKVDRAGLNARLSALLEQMDKLPLAEEGVRLPVEGSEQVTPSAAKDDSGFSIEKVLDDLWRGFKSMMVIRHHDKPITAMLPPEQRYFLIQNLRLKLEGAKAALLGRNQALFHDSLVSAATWVEQYFATDSPEVQGFLHQLDALSGEQIAPDLPDITDSLRALQEQRAQMNRGGTE
jgi:uroporphyrin-3 C-methyltransferase